VNTRTAAPPRPDEPPVTMIRFPSISTPGLLEARENDPYPIP
jgi:hypothetical protein